MAIPDLYVSCTVIDDLGNAQAASAPNLVDTAVAAVPRKRECVLIDDDTYEVVDVVWELPGADRPAQSATLFLRLVAAG